MTEVVMKIVNINNAPTIRDSDDIIRSQLSDLGKIVDNIDEAEGRNDALRAYIYALRDLQRANEMYACYGESDATLDSAHARVRETFDRLIVAQSQLLQL